MENGEKDVNAMEQSRPKTALFAQAASMVIFGTIGLFRRWISLPSSMIALTRAVTGTLFLLVVMALGKKRLSREAIRRNGKRLMVSGAILGFNWILLFEAYRYTSVATATLCYYMAPVIVILVSPLLGERLTRRRIACVLAALCGMVLVSGILGAGFAGGREFTGVLFGLGAAALYASVMLVSRQIREISAYDKTVTQLGISAALLLPYTLLTQDLAGVSIDARAAAMLLVVGVVHTGVAYALYFGSVHQLRAQTVALLSYVDPVVAIVLSALVLGESMTAASAVGALLVLGGAVVSEIPEKTRERKG